MKNSSLLTIKTLVYALSALPLTVAQAGLKTSAELTKGGTGAVQFEASGKTEVCVIPQKISGFANSAYSSKDLDRESELCALNFYESGSVQPSTVPSKTVAVCPKLNSTNPGTLLVEIPKESTPWTQAQTEAAFCKQKSSIDRRYKESYDVDAKFKQSITCSYAPSALAAYHLSRLLGGILNTPVAVVRTMDRNRHNKLIQKALGLLSGDPASIIYKSWSQFSRKSQEQNDEKLYADNGQMLFGALSANVKKEFIYTEVSGVGPYDTRYQRFLQQKPFQRVASSQSLEEIAQGSTFKAVAPVAQQMKDVSDMIVLDSLLSQDDRIGNIHFQLAWLKQGENGEMVRTMLKGAEIKAIEALNPAKAPSRWPESSFTNASGAKGVLARIMVLKDNDCGVDVDKRSNQMRSISAIEQVRHMSPITYQQLLRLKQLADRSDSGLKEFFQNTLLYREKDYALATKRGFLENLNRVISVIKKNCESGQLQLDLSPTFQSGGSLIPHRGSAQDCSFGG